MFDFIRHSRSFDLLPFDAEIERTYRRLNRERREALQKQQLIMAEKIIQENRDARLLLDYVVPTISGTRSSIARCVVQANNFGIIQMIQMLVQFVALLIPL